VLHFATDSIYCKQLEILEDDHVMSLPEAIAQVSNQRTPQDGVVATRNSRDLEAYKSLGSRCRLDCFDCWGALSSVIRVNLRPQLGGL
jgi:hypothetical protein